MFIYHVFAGGPKEFSHFYHKKKEKKSFIFVVGPLSSIILWGACHSEGGPDSHIDYNTYIACSCTSVVGVKADGTTLNVYFGKGFG